MADEHDPHQSKLIDRLAGATLRLRNLFYVNLLLAAAVIFLVFQDRTFVSERIAPAVSVLQPILKVDAHLKNNKPRFQAYQDELLRVFSLVQETSLALDRMEERVDALSEEERDKLEAATERELTEDQIDLVEDLSYFHEESEGAKRLLQGYFELDLTKTDYQHLAGFAAFLYADYWTLLLEQGRSILLTADEILPGDILNREEAQALDLRQLGLRRYNDEISQDTVLDNLLLDLPETDDLFRAILIIETFCTANKLGTCSIEDINKWQEEQATQTSSKLSAPGIEVNLARELVVPASPLVLLVAFHLYLMQFRRRQVLRSKLIHQLEISKLNLLDESWILNGLVLNIAGVEDFWRRLQSGLMAAFLLLGQSMPLAAVAAAGYYTFKQVLLGAFIAEEFVWAMDDLKEAAASIGVENLPATPMPPGLFWEYLWIAIAAFCALVLAGSLYQLTREQMLEIVGAWKRKKPS